MLSRTNWGKITYVNFINHTVVSHYLVNNNDGVYALRYVLFIILQFKTPLVVNAAQHSTTTVYITTLTYEKDTFDPKSIPSQTDITEQRFSEERTVKTCLPIVQSSIKS